MEIEKNIIEPALYIVPTPIGNLEDITLRALKVLTSCDLIACEDTRTTSNLFKLLKIKYNKLVSYHNFNEADKADFLVSQILSGKSLALVSDAGTPSISDPGYRIVESAIKSGVKIISLPGPTAMITALVASGMPVHSFTFFGFPPKKKGRKTFLESIELSLNTAIIYESSHKILDLIEELCKILNKDRKICVSRELTKLHEEYIRGTINEVFNIVKVHKSLKGEFVVIVEGKQKGK